MSIDELVKINVAPCFHKGYYHYRAKGDLPGEYFCALSDSRCPYHYAKSNKEYCVAKGGRK